MLVASSLAESAVAFVGVNYSHERVECMKDCVFVPS